MTLRTLPEAGTPEHKKYLTEICNIIEGPADPVYDQLKRGPDKRDQNGMITKRGKPYPTPRNCHIVLTQHEEWVERLKYNEFAQTVELDGARFRDEDCLPAQDWFDTAYDFLPSKTLMFDAMVRAAEHNSYHPVKEYLSGLVWDGQSRCAGLLAHYMGAIDCELHSAYSMRWFISCVARIFRAGAKVDTTLILQGRQGVRKSTAFRVLAVNPEWFSDTALDFKSKDARQDITGIWLYEVAELTGIRKSDAEIVKAFLSAQSDTFRPAYGRATVVRKRQTVFCGTTNESEFLNDGTGSRRFWPVRVSDIDLGKLKADRNQMWAEAVHWFNDGAEWWLTDDEEKLRVQRSDEFSIQDEWINLINGWLDSRIHIQFTTWELIEQAFGKEPQHQTKTDTRRAADILREAGWARTKSPVKHQCESKGANYKARVWQHATE